MATLEEVHIEDEIDQEILNSSTDDIVNRTRLLENDIKVTASSDQFLIEGHEIRDTTVNA
jgi:26S proteasome regulatory subunit T5